MRTFFVGSKDNGSFNVLCPIVRKFLQSGNRCNIFAEGPSARRWLTELDCAEVVFSGPEQVPYDLGEFENVARSIPCPDAVIVGYSAPIHLEEALALFAKARGIPLIGVCDNWGAHRLMRSSIVPDLVLTLDDEGSRMVREDFADETIAEAIGHPLLTALTNADMCSTREYITQMRIEGCTTVLLAGQEDSTRDAINWLASAIARSDEDLGWRIIPRMNPKFTRLWADQFCRIARHFRDGVVTDPIAQDLDYNHLAALCDVTVSNFSTALTVAACFNRLPVAVLSGDARSELNAYFRSQDFPLERMGGCAVAGEMPLSDMLDACRDMKWSSAFGDDWRFEPERAVKAIEAVIL